DPERFSILFRLVQRGKFWMCGDGKTYYHPLYIDNLTDAFLLAAEKKVTSGETFLVADQQYWTLNDLVRYVAEALHRTVRIRHLPYQPVWWASWICEASCRPLKIPPPLFPRRVAWFRQDRAFSIEKARRLLGYEPRVGIHEGLSRTACWYREHGIL